MATKRNGIGVLMGVELVLNGANLNFVAFSRFTLLGLDGQIMSLFVIVLAAAEAAIALAIALNFYNNHLTIDVDRGMTYKAELHWRPIQPGPPTARTTTAARTQSLPGYGISMDSATYDSTGILLRNLLTVAWLLPLGGFIVEIFARYWSDRLSKSAAYIAVCCIGGGFVCSAAIALYQWGEATASAALAGHGDAHANTTERTPRCCTPRLLRTVPQKQCRNARA